MKGAQDVCNLAEHVINTLLLDDAVIMVTVVDVSMKLNHGGYVPGMEVLFDFAIIKAASTQRFGDCVNYMEGRTMTFVVWMDVQIVSKIMGKKAIRMMERQSSFVCTEVV
mmetsp:Transcript_27704/g.43589  ORF Transcript_27704/g.43589 Transcript_27704/m.43589 type:complete len:110 (+) Transcript_27704:293-622(+)